MVNFVRFDSKDLFNGKLRDGISLFLGAGFSVEANDINGEPLPVGGQLLVELKNKFERIQGFPDLSKASTVLEATNKEGFYQYLKDRFTVGDYNEKYSILNEINIKNIYTTNIDNLLFKIFSESSRYYLNNTSIRGSSYSQKNSISYFPLHGCILNPEKGYIFSKTKIASAYTDSQDDWNNLRKTVSNDAIVFWGWSFEDSDAIEAIYNGKNYAGENTEKWIILYKPKNYEISFYEALNFKIIISDSKNMLDYMSECIDNRIEDNIISSKFFSEYSIPARDDKTPVYPLVSFFEGDAPRWSHIFSGAIPKTHYYNKVSDYIASNKNVFVVGIPASGKTTLMMQLLCDYPTKKHKHFLTSPTKEEVNLYLKKVGDQSCLLFIDECFRDISIPILLFNKKNIQLIGFDRDYAYESQAYRFRDALNEYEVCDITEINDFDSRKIIDSIPSEVKKEYTTIQISDPTIFSLILKNLKKQRFEKRFATMVDEFYRTNPNATELFIMICYVHSCGVPVSFDMIYSYLRDITNNYIEVYQVIREVGDIIKECSDTSFNFLNVNFEEQDYYQSRSRYFAELIIKNLPSANPVLKKVLKTFIANVPAYKICRFDFFKRKGYDADYTTKAFLNYTEGLEYYKACSEIDESEYLYQQAALYFSRKKEYTLAFEWIERARNFSTFNRFSIDNTHAIIQFSANINAEDTDGSVIKLLIESLEILKNCYSNDKRKSTHAKTFASLSLDFYKRVGYEQSINYVDIAFQWLQKEKDNIDCSRDIKREMKHLYHELSSIINLK